MPTHLAFLRAINLGPTRKFAKDTIRAASEAAGFTDVETYINTGNVRVTSSLRSRARVEDALETSFLRAAGFEVPTIAFTQVEFAAIATDADEVSAGLELARHYVYLMKQAPDAETAASLEARSGQENRVVIRGRGAHVLLGAGYTAGQVDPLNVANLLGVATNRNVNVVRTLAQRWC